VIRAALISFLAGVLAGFAAGWKLARPGSGGGPKDPIKITRLKGPGVIVHKDWQFEGPAVKFRTVSTGAAEILTDVPKGRIPEADRWMNARNGIQASVLYQYYNSQSHLNYSLQYFRRWGAFSLGGGLAAGPDTIGMQAGAMYWW
jgi:hypothetical protein